jgi:hypothetical protein
VNSTAGIIYGEAVRALEEQESNLDGLRVRTGTLLAAISLITAFLGAQSVAHHGGASLGRAGWVAVSFFVASAVGGLIVLWPWTWSFVVSPTTLIEDHVEIAEPTSPDDLALYLARIHDENWNANAARLEALFWTFRVATLCLAAEVVSWLISLTVA